MKFKSTTFNIAAVFLIIIFIAKCIYDYLNYSSAFTSAPFYLWILVNSFYLLLPAIILFIVALVLKKKEQKDN